MSIQIHLDNILKDRNMTAKELSEKIGITEANLSILRSNKGRAIRFTTLNQLCKVLQCKPGDIIHYIEDEIEEEEHE